MLLVSSSQVKSIVVSILFSISVIFVKSLFHESIGYYRLLGTRIKKFDRHARNLLKVKFLFTKMPLYEEKSA